MSHNKYEFPLIQEISISLQNITKQSVVMIPQETEREAVQADKRYIDTGKIERTAGYSVGLFINRCPQIVPFILMNDKTPIWDGELFIYENEKSIVENFSARVPLQVKGTTNTKDDFYRIERKYLEGYKNDGGSLFFLVKVDENYNSSKILYAKLSLEDTKTLLLQKKSTIKIDLDVVPPNPIDFQIEVIKFAEKRKIEKNVNSAPKEIETIVNYFKEIDVDEIGNENVRRDLKSLLNTITTVRDDGTIGWRDDFIYYSQKAIKLVNNIKKKDFPELQFEFGLYLYKQKQYHLVEDYYLNALKVYRERANNNPDAYMGKVAQTLNNLASLHSDLNRPEEAESEYKEALEIYRGLAKDNPDAYRGDVAMTLNNLAVLHLNLNRHKEAEMECKEALKIYRGLAKDNPAAYMGYLAATLNNLAALHSVLNRHKEAEGEYKEALEFYRGLANKSPTAYRGKVALTLNNLAILHKNLNRTNEGEEEYNEALKIYRELAKDNPNAYMGDVAMTLNNLASLHDDLNRPVEAEKEYQEALKIYRGLAKDNPEAYMGKVAKSLYGLAYIYIKQNNFSKAIDTFQEAIILKPDNNVFHHLKKDFIQRLKADGETELDL